MRVMSPDEIKTALEQHKVWLDGNGGARANLAGANLVEANLAGANLAGANLAEANLAGANLVEANLAGANLAGANLPWANLVEANLAGANLAEANLAGANLAEANLVEANLAGANLAGANLAGANLDISVCRMDFGRWSICIQPGKTSIGYQTHANADWLRWLPADVVDFADGAADWWQTHGDAVKAAIRCVMAKHDAITRAAK